MTLKEFNFNTLVDALEADNRSELKKLLSKLNPATISESIENLDNHHRQVVFTTLDSEKQTDVIKYLEESTLLNILDSLDDESVRGLIADMAHDQRVDLLKLLPADRKQAIMKNLAKAEREDIKKLSSYKEGTTGAIMTTDYAVIRKGVSVQDALETLRNEAPDRETIYYAYVVDNDRKLVGSVSLRGLIVAEPKKKVEDIMTTDVVTVRPDDPDHETAQKLKETDLIAVPVINGDDMLMGIVTFDDAMQVIEEDTSETMYQKAGVGTFTTKEHEKDLIYSERLTQGSIAYPVKLRIAFLMVTLVGGFLVGGLIDHFEDVLAAVVVAAVFIPVIMDMGGNVATQSTTIFARGLALGHIDIKKIVRHIGREVSIGAVMGTILGVIGGVAAYYWQGVPNDVPEIGIAVGLSLFIVVPVATFLGFLLPYILVKLGWDHAPGADPFITTIKDFSGLGLYFILVGTLIGV